MNWLVFYIRSCFCIHQWKREEARCEYPLYDTWNIPTGNYRTTIMVSATCEKCGWHRSYEKY